MTSETRKPLALVINDNRTQLLMMEEILTEDGIEVLACRSGDEALRLLSGGISVDLIVTDLHMPDIDGWSLCSVLRSADYLTCNWVPILAVSAVAEEEGQRVVLQLGADGFLKIPYSRSELKEKVHALIDKRVMEPRRTVFLCMSASGLGDEVERSFLNSGDVLRRLGSLAELPALASATRPDVLLLDQPAFDEDARRQLAEVFGTSWPITVVIARGLSAVEKVPLIRGGADACVDWPDARSTLMLLLARLKRLRALVARDRAGVPGKAPS